MISPNIQRKVKLLERALSFPTIVCGVDHERHAPHFACSQTSLENPRMAIGCVHTDLVKLTYEVASDLYKNHPSAFLQSISERTQTLQLELNKLDNTVYEGKESSIKNTKEKQAALGKELASMIRLLLASINKGKF